MTMHCVTGPKMLTGTKAGTRNITGPEVRPEPEIRGDQAQGPGPALVQDQDWDQNHDQEWDKN